MTKAGRILALDASTTAVGWCAADGDQYVASGVYKPDGGKAWERIDDFGMWLCLMLQLPDGPQLVAYEEPHGNHGNRRTDRLLGAVMGTAARVCSENRVQFVRVHNAKVRATGYHKRAIGEAQLLVGRRGMTGDEADAIGVWQAVLVMMREEAQ